MSDKNRETVGLLIDKLSKMPREASIHVQFTAGIDGTVDMNIYADCGNGEGISFIRQTIPQSLKRAHIATGGALN
jgi:hypothetical protein